MVKFVALVGALMASSAFAKDIIATNCEVFIDKFSVNYERMGLYEMQVFLKVVPARLDSAVKSVVFYSMEERDDTSSRTWDAARLPGFVGASDYFRTWLPIGGDHMEIRHVGAFYVETERGTRYWVNPAHGGNFKFDKDYIYDLEESVKANGDAQGLYAMDVARLTKTADYFPKANPQLCR